jgi:hypothetical protein
LVRSWEVVRALWMLGSSGVATGSTEVGGIEKNDLGEADVGGDGYETL